VRHQRAGKKLGRDSAHRKALYSNLAGALIEHGRIKTTVTKAKAVKPYAEQMITLGRRGDLHARRQATAFLRSRDVVHKLFAEVAPRYKDRPGGYARIIKIGTRAGDAAEMAYLELVEEELAPKEPRRAAAVAEAPVAAPVEETAEEEPVVEDEPDDDADVEDDEPAESDDPVAEAETETDEPVAEAEGDAPAADDEKA
jgi:large subunit ribosomal protein L17